MVQFLKGFEASTYLFLSTVLQTSNLKTFHPEMLKKSNHILRNCKNADIRNQIYGIPDLMTPRLSSYEFGKFQVGGQISLVTVPWGSIATFLYSRIWEFSTVLAKKKVSERKLFKFAHCNLQ